KIIYLGSVAIIDPTSALCYSARIRFAPYLGVGKYPPDMRLAGSQLARGAQPLCPLRHALRTIFQLILTCASYATVGYGLTSASLSFASSVVPAKFEETLLKVVPVSGSVLTGVQYTDSTMSATDS